MLSELLSLLEDSRKDIGHFTVGREVFNTADSLFRKGNHRGRDHGWGCEDGSKGKAEDGLSTWSAAR